MTSILFDSTFRSGNHFAVALLKKAFSDIKLYWGYKYKHNPESFNLPKDKFNYYMTIIRKPTDSIASQIAELENPTSITMTIGEQPEPPVTIEE